jgi:hypothetical protein
MYVVTADQKRSRHGPDRVPDLLAQLAEHTQQQTERARRTGHGAGPGVTRPFERTAGDEVQGLLESPAAVVDVLVTLLRGGWWVGIGAGSVDDPVPATARAGRGPAYLAARQAVESAKSAPSGVCIVAGADEHPGARAAAERAEAAAWLLGSVLGRRSPQGWEVVDLVAAGARGIDAAAKLGISAQAVSSRLRVAGWAEEQRGRELLTWLLGRIEGEA